MALCGACVCVSVASGDTKRTDGIKRGRDGRRGKERSVDEMVRKMTCENRRQKNECEGPEITQISETDTERPSDVFTLAALVRLFLPVVVPHVAKHLLVQS